MRKSMKSLTGKIRKDHSGFLSLKTAILTAGVALAAVTTGSAIAVTVMDSSDANLMASGESGICVTATNADDSSIFATRGNCFTTPPQPDDSFPEISVNEVTGKMVTTWDTDADPMCQEINLPISDFEGTINWNGEVLDSNLSHSFAEDAGIVKVGIDGNFSSWGNEEWGGINVLENTESQCLISVDKWSDTGTKNLDYAFSKAINLKHVEGIPSTTTSLEESFANTSYGGRYDVTLGHPDGFDTSNVTNMSGMFRNSYFNHPISFNTQNVKNFSFMFGSTMYFNQPVNFDTRSAENMTGMFTGAYAFNQPLNFNTSKVTHIDTMFEGATNFNQALNFDTSNVVSMNSVFNRAESFNQDISAWNIAKVEYAYYIFMNAESFNQDLSDWNTSGILDINNRWDENTPNWTKPKPNFSPTW